MLIISATAAALYQVMTNNKYIKKTDVNFWHRSYILLTFLFIFMSVNNYLISVFEPFAKGVAFICTNTAAVIISNLLQPWHCIQRSKAFKRL